MAALVNAQTQLFHLDWDNTEQREALLNRMQQNATDWIQTIVKAKVIDPDLTV